MVGKALMRFLDDLLRRTRHLPWPWPAALAALVLLSGFYLGVVMPARHALSASHQHEITLQRDLVRLQQSAEEAARKTPASQLQVFEGYFPTENTVPDTVELILDLAQNKGLTPKQAEYRMIRTHPGPLLSYQIRLPIKGSYPRVLEFASVALSKVQNLTLDNLSFQRQKIGDDQVDATLQLTLYLRREP